MKFLIVLVCMLPFVLGCSKERQFECFLDQADLNHDHALDANEINAAVDANAGWFVRSGFYMKGGGASLVGQCDTDGDGMLTMVDIENSDCFKDCSKMKDTVSELGIDCLK